VIINSFFQHKYNVHDMPRIQKALQACARLTVDQKAVQKEKREKLVVTLEETGATMLNEAQKVTKTHGRLVIAV
jgi:hypothetical protein